MTSWAFAAPFRLSLAGTVGLAADFEAVAGSGSLTVGAQIATLSVTSESGSGSRPYAATVLPLRGEVPSGSHVSNAAGTEVGDIIGTHDDGSAKVVVFASSASATGSVALHVATGTAPAALDVSAITALVSSLAVEFGGGFGTATAAVASPERTWWATSKTLCARYRLAAPTPGSTALEAVVDVHAYAGSLFAEMVVENCKVDASGTPATPSTANYGTAVLKINGSTVATVTTPTRGTRLAGSAITLTGVDMSVLSFAFGAPPGSPTTGAAYALWASGTTGDWAGRGGQIATWNGSAWDYTAATAGNVVQQTASYDWPRIWTGSAWEAAHLGTHEGHRAAYASGWVGTSGAGLRVTQLHTELQANPMFWEAAAANSADMSTYASDAYAQFGPGRHRATNMGGTGDHPSIGPLPTAAAFALVTGDYRAWKATEAEDLAVLGYNVNYRHSTGASAGLVPCVNETGNRSQQTGWPSLGNNAEAMQWKDSHHPAAGLAGFVSRPSPVFIEIAQKVALKVGTTYSDNDGGPTRAIGVFVAAFQTRAQAWGMRSLGHATFLSPDGSTWKTGGQGSIAANVAHFDEWRTSASQTALAIMWENRVDRPIARNSNTTRVNYKLWQYHFFLSEMAKIASARLVTAGANQTALDTFVDWGLLHPVRWINDQATTGAWRHMPEALVLGTAVQTAPAMTNAADYATQRATWTTEAPSVAAVAGTWMAAWLDSPTNYSSQWVADTTAGLSHATYFWPALCAAVDRGVAGSAEAYWHIRNNITNFDTWLGGFGGAPRWGANPRTIPPPVGFAAGADAGTYNSTTKVWVPGKTSGVVNAASWAIVPTGEWVEIDGSRIDTLTTEIAAAGLGWGSSTLAWNAVLNAWNGVAIDQDGSRVWLVCAGGHADSSNNGVYRFDCFKMAWAVERMPSDRNLWSTDYKTISSGHVTYTGCNESIAATPQAGFGEEAATAATRKWHSDQLFWDVRPTSRHVYSTPVYKASTNELIHGCRTIWKYNITSGDWTYNRRWNVEVDGAEIQGVYDEVTDQYLFAGMGDTRRVSATYNLASDTFGSAGWCPWIGIAADGDGWEGVADTRHGRNITVWSPPFSDRVKQHYAVYNLDSRTQTTGPAKPQYGGGLSAADFKSTSSGADGAGMVYVPPLNEYWILYQMVSGTRWLKLDPTTAPWTISPKTFTGTLPAVYDKPCRKIVWMPDLNAVMLWSRDDRGAYVYKF